MNWYEIGILLGYEVLAVALARRLVRFARPDKDLERYFDGVYFLWQWSIRFGLLAQFSLLVLVCGMFWTRQSLAVGTTTLLVIPGTVIIGSVMQNGFYRRYNRLVSLIRRLEALGPAERAALLETLPPEVFLQLPGDYRIVSWQEDRRPHN